MVRVKDALGHGIGGPVSRRWPDCWTIHSIVIGGALGLLLLVQGAAWVLGYRKSHADAAERA
jgi:hypothetical protein